MHVTFMFTEGGFNNLSQGEGKCVSSYDVSCGIPPCADGFSSPLQED